MIIRRLLVLYQQIQALLPVMRPADSIHLLELLQHTLQTHDIEGRIIHEQNINLLCFERGFDLLSALLVPRGVDLVDGGCLRRLIAVGFIHQLVVHGAKA